MTDAPAVLTKSEGVTEAERYLKTLCDSTFLSLWSFPGVYRVEGKGKGLSKEVCDLLVVFGNHIIIFSDKACEFPRTDDLAKDWQRWFRRAVVSSANQVWGAERWIREHPDRLFVDRLCKVAFPFDLPPKADVRFHLIVVAHHAAARCSEVLGGSGSFMFQSDIKGIEAHLAKADPFIVGDLHPQKTFVHVLDDTSLGILLRTLDTISDFVSYLARKERFLRSSLKIFSTGEEELLASYLKRLGPDGCHDFVVPRNCNMVLFEEGLWEDFERNPQRHAQVAANRVSYSWDMLIEKFSHHAVTNTQHFASPRTVQATEKILRFMAAEPRTRRRMLGGALLEMLETTPIDKRRTRVLLPSHSNDPFYVFLLLPKPDHVVSEVYRNVRFEWLAAACTITRWKYPAALDVVGIATETGLETESRSEDALYLDARDWTEAENEDARRLQEETGLLTALQERRVQVKEYPTLPKVAAKGKVGRNDPCPCGSGMKYKKCCARRY